VLGAEWNLNLTRHLDFAVWIWPYISISVSVLVPGLLLVASLLRASKTRHS